MVVAKSVKDSQGVVDYDPFAGGELSRVVPTTEPQREIWLVDQLGEEASLAYNESVTLHLTGRLDGTALRKALQAVLDRHSALRANFGPDGETLCVLEHVEVDLQLHDLSSTSPQQREAAVRQHQRLAVETPFSLGSDRLLRTELLRLAQDDHLLILTAHHAVCDGWSWWVLVRELGTLYALKRGDVVEPLPAADDFADYALEQARHPAGATFAADESYWLSRFAGEIPILDLPTDRSRPARRGFASAREDWVFAADLLTAIRTTGAHRGVSLFATLLGSFAALLARLANQTQVVIGIPTAGQSIDGHDHLVGHCVNTLPLLFEPDMTQPAVQAIDEAQTTLLDALEHQRYTFGTLLSKLRIGRDPSRLPLVSVMFNIDQALDHEDTAFPELQLEFASNPRSFENFELSINAVQTHGELRLECQYNRDLFDAATVRRWLCAYETMLRAAVAQPSVILGELPLVDEAGRRELAAWQPAPTPFDAHRCAHEFFEAQCDRAPDRVAVRAGTEALSYMQLEERANRIAHLLRARGVRGGALVGIALGRGFDMLAALLGVLKAGAAYVPLDPAFPQERLDFMVSDAGLAALLTEQAHATRFDLRGRPVLVLDQLGAELAAQPATRIGQDAAVATAAASEAPAYVIYTSGSTGRPKGVRVPHRATANFLTAMQEKPGLHAHDRLVAVTTLSFDIAFLELMLPLAVGAEVVMASHEQVRDGAMLRQLLETSGATCLQATPATWRMLLQLGWQGTPGFRALCGGEALAQDLATELMSRCGELWNMYGPTETTVWSTCWRVENPQHGISIGTPIANTTVWILDPRGQICPIGVPGEIWIGGRGVTLGYHNRPELTAERFIADPRAEHPDARMYRTGDRGRWLANGTLEHLGRLDFQVKVRGFRIELGEIEANLAVLPEVGDVVVMVREDRPGDARLVAYLVASAGTKVDEAGLRPHLRQVLPEYMVPQHFIVLDAMPLLPNGKIDRARLPAPAQAMPREGAVIARVGPRDELEKKVAAAMATALGRADFGRDDNFFDLGGHSLLASRVIARLNRELGLSLSLRTAFDAPTVALMATAIRALDQGAEGARSAQLQPIPRLTERQHAPLSLMQQRLWYLEQLNPGQVTYNTPSAHRLRGAINEVAFERALREMVQHQPVLRTSIEQSAGRLIQSIHEEVEVSLLPVEDLGGLPEAEREAALTRRLDALIAEPFDLARPPLFRARLFRLGAEDHVFFFMVHHMVWDGWSFDLMYEEMSSLYAAFCAGQPASLEPLAIEYGDFAAWHAQWLRSDELARQLGHWRQRLAGTLEPLELPTDRPRPPRMSGAGATEWIHLSAEQKDALRELGQQQQSTLYMVLLAAYYLLLHRLSGQRDLLVSTPVRGRNMPEFEPIMGFFVNALPLRLQLDPEASFVELLRAVRGIVLDAFSCPDVPFEHLVIDLDLPRDKSRPSFSQAMFSFQDARQRPLCWGDLEHESMPVFQRGASDDLGLWIVDRGGELTGGITYSTDLFDASTAARWVGYLQAILGQALASPEAPISDFELMDAAERHQVLEDWNATATEYDRGTGLPALIEAQMHKTPKRIAAECGAERIDYAGLEQATRGLALALGRRGIGRGDFVGVCVPRSLSMLVAVVGVLRSGAAYVPLDPTFPPERLRHMAEQSRLRHLLVTGAELLPPLVAAGRELLRVDELAGEFGDGAELPVVRGEDVAYVLYTSGSTGKPKGVSILHRNLVNFLLSASREPGFSEEDTVCAATTLSFDISALELYLPLIAGGRMVIADDEQCHNPKRLWDLIDKTGCNLLLSTPSLVRLLQDTGPDRAARRLRLVVGGEALPLALAKKMATRCREFWNMYGPTETTIWSSVARMRPDLEVVSLGKPIDNTRIYVLDERGRPVPPGVVGEIWIGGDGVADGYLFQPEMTAERFVADPFVGGTARMYRTGDLGAWQKGELHFHGRVDQQIKVRGFRVEPGEIEAVAGSHPAVRECVLVAREFGDKDLRMILYAVVDDPQDAVARQLREYLRERLPAYMLPQHIEMLAALPKTPTRKIDRNALSLPVAAATVAQVHPIQAKIAAPTPPTQVMADPRELYIAAIWRELIGVQDVRSNDNFLDLGGHSMLAVEFVTRVQSETSVSLRLLDVVTGTLASLAAELPKNHAPQTRQGSVLSRLRQRLGLG